MLFIFAAAICIHMYIFTAVFDLLDVVVLIAIIGIVVDLPIHVILHYQHLRSIEKAEDIDQKIRHRRLIESSSIREVSVALSSTNRYMRFSLLQLLVLTLICGIPLLFATFVLLQKTGEYLVIIAIVSYVFSIGMLPYLIAFGRQLFIWRKLQRLCGCQPTATASSAPTGSPQRRVPIEYPVQMSDGPSSAGVVHLDTVPTHNIIYSESMRLEEEPTAPPLTDSINHEQYRQYVGDYITPQDFRDIDEMVYERAAIQNSPSKQISSSSSAGYIMRL
jgi:hypothetical protein